MDSVFVRKSGLHMARLIVRGASLSIEHSSKTSEPIGATLEVLFLLPAFAASRNR
jgi:hypothetical protein